MARTRVPVRGSIGKSILTGQTSSTTVNNTTVVNQTVRSNAGGGGTVSSTIWPLIQGVPLPILDIAALTTLQVGLLTFNGTNVLNRSIAVDAKLTITNPAGVAGNPTIGFANEAANTALMGPDSGSAAGPTFRALTTSDIPALSIEDLSDVTISSVSSGQVLEWNGTAWVNASGGGSLSLEDLTDVVITLPMIGDSITWNGTDWVNTPSVGGGTVTSVALADLSTTQLYAISGSPITTAGTLDLTLKAQNANTALMGPASGSAAAPTMRAIVAADLPEASASAFGIVKVDGTSITATGGVISATGGGGGGSVTVTDGTNSVAAVTTLTISGAPVSTGGTGLATVSVNVTPDTHPVTPTAYDDEFEESTVAGKWGWTNQNSATDSLSSGSLLLTAQASGGGAINTFDETLPIGACTFVIKAGLFVPGASGFAGALSLREAATGKVFTFGIFNSGGTPLLVSAIGTVSGGYTANPVANTASPPWFSAANGWPSAQSYWKVSIAATTFQLSVSQDGITWGVYGGATFTTSAYFTVAPDHVGFAFQQAASGGPPQLSIDWIRRTA